MSSYDDEGRTEGTTTERSKMTDAADVITQLEQLAKDAEAEAARMRQAAAVLGGKAAPAVEPKPRSKSRKPRKTAKKRTISAEGRRRMSEAAKRRWAEKNDRPEEPVTVPEPEAVAQFE